MTQPGTFGLAQRRDVWDLLCRLEPHERVRFVRWCCKQVRGPDGVAEVRVTTHTGTVAETFCDLLQLEQTFHLDLARAALELERRVKRS